MADGVVYEPHNHNNEDAKARLSRIRGGMSVFDSSGEEVGEVVDVHLPLRPKMGAEAYSEETVVVDTADSIAAGEMPQALAQQLLRSGFARVDTGLLTADRFVTPEQVRAVADNKVYLLVRQDELLEHGEWE